MAFRAAPSYMQNGSHSAEDDRLVLNALEKITGLAYPSALSIVQSASSGLTVTVTAGPAWIKGTARPNQGTYHVYNDAQVVVPLATAPGSTPRRDYLFAVIRDTDVDGAIYGTGNGNDVIFKWITAAAGAAVSGPPASSICLGWIDIPANATAITTTNIYSQPTYIYNGTAGQPVPIRPISAISTNMFIAEYQAPSVNAGRVFSWVHDSGASPLLMALQGTGDLFAAGGVTATSYALANGKATINSVGDYATTGNVSCQILTANTASLSSGRLTMDGSGNIATTGTIYAANYIYAPTGVQFGVTGSDPVLVPTSKTMMYLTNPGLGQSVSIDIGTLFYKGLVNNSSRTVKSDIGTLDHGLDTLLSLNPVTFRYTAEQDGPVRAGFIAEDMHETYSFATHYSEETGEPDGVDISQMIPLLVQSVKELASQVNDLRRQIEQKDK